MKKRFVILKNELIDDHTNWIKACEKVQDKVDYETIDFLDGDQIKRVLKGSYDMILAKPPGISANYKNLYDQTILLFSLSNIKIYPTPLEIFIYENKSFLYSWLSANELPHPDTSVFHYKNKALDFAKDANYPLVAKTNIGASGSGVKVLRNYKEAKDYINISFSKKGAPKRWGPNLEKGNIIGRGLQYLKNPSRISPKIKIYIAKKAEKQQDIVLFQKFIPHTYEWRVVVIGESFFAHKKLKNGEKASGSLLKKYDRPPEKLLFFAKGIMERFGFYSQAIDIFEDEYGSYYVNELQCIFGQSEPYQMLIEGKPGRFVFKNNEWIFEEGMYNENESYDLRIKHALLLAGSK